MMKLHIRTIALTALVFCGTAHASDPCETLMCMAGLVDSGSVTKGCDSGTQAFFDIVVKKHGSFKASATSEARKQFINSCPGSDKNSDPVQKIISKFGGQRSL